MRCTGCQEFFIGTGARRCPKCGKPTVPFATRVALEDENHELARARVRAAIEELGMGAKTAVIAERAGVPVARTRRVLREMRSDQGASA